MGRTGLAADQRGQFARTTTALLDEDPRVALVYAEISGALLADAERRHPDRVVNVGIREQALVGVGAGLALTGMTPVVHTFSSFLVERALEQVKLDFSHQDVGGVLVGAAGSFDVAAGGRTHQAPGDVALVDTLPGFAVHAPGSPAEVDLVLRAAVADGGRHYVRVVGQDDTTPRALAEPGLQVLRRGSRGTVVVLGPLLDAALAATEGLDLTLAHATTVRPFDAHGLRAAVAATGSPDVVLVEPWLVGTSAWPVAEALRERPHRLLALGVGRHEHRHYGTPAQHVAAHGLDAPGLRRSVTAFLAAD